MDVRCGKCNLDYGLELERVEESFSIDCANCGVVVRAERRLADGTGAGRQPTTSGAAGAHGQTWYLRPAGKREPRFCENATVLQQWISAGVVTRDWDISSDASNWKPIRGIAELQPLFDHADAGAERAVVSSAPRLAEEQDVGFFEADTLDDLGFSDVEVVDLDPPISAENLGPVPADTRALVSSDWTLGEDPTDDDDVGALAEPIHTLSASSTRRRPWLLSLPGALLFLGIGAIAAFLLDRGAHADHDTTAPITTSEPGLPPPESTAGVEVPRPAALATPVDLPATAPAKTAAAPELDYEALVERADRHAARGARQSATRLYRRALVRRQDGAAALAGLGYCLLDAGRYAEARQRFRAALAAAPNHQDARLGVAESYAQQGLDDDAGAGFAEYLRRHPQGRHAGIARNQLQRLTPAAGLATEARPATSAASPPPVVEPEPSPPAQLRGVAMTPPVAPQVDDEEAPPAAK